LIFFGFFDSGASWQRVLEVLCNFEVDLKSTDKMFSVDFIRLSVDFRIYMMMVLYV